MKNLLICFLLLSLCTFSLHAQERVIQAFNYDSETRDSMITFPDDDHNKWEKILMVYSMRCKDGLVSPPIAGQTNIGCGEWDYSCNTYITDSSQVDSIFSISPDHVITNFDGDVFEYRSSPTYEYYQSTLKEVNYTNTIAEENFIINEGSDVTPVFFGIPGNGHRIQYHIKKSDLETGLFSAGHFSGIKLEGVSGTGNFTNFKIRIKHYSNAESPICFQNAGFEEVFYQDATLDENNNWLRFHENFEWNGTDDLLMDISFEVISSDLFMSGLAAVPEKRVIHANSSDKVMNFNSSGALKVEGDFSAISDQITIAFWSNGDDVLPTGTSIIEATDEQNLRQLNVHLPWGNSQVYWDCGNDGNGYDRINRVADAADFKNNWTHWTFTKNANTGSMKIYKDGILWHSGTAKNKLMNIKSLSIGATVDNGRGYFGSMDDFRIWNKELSADAIQESLCTNLSNLSPIFDDLILAYDFNQDIPGEVIDISLNGFDATIDGVVGYQAPFGRNLNGTPTQSFVAPTITLVRGEYESSITDIVKLDSVENMPNKVDRYVVVGTDLILDETNFYYAAGEMPVYNEDGNIVDFIQVNPENSITINDLEHYSKNPMQMEIMSFVTPYGINLDLGIEGKAWTFDVTDLGPVLKGDKRIYLTRGGQWQEDMDIKFLFYEGTPTRNVISVQQIWPVQSTNYTVIQADGRYEPRTIVKNAEDAFVVAKTTITGHGQEGEFIPRNHILSLDDIPFVWQVWTECADNPIYPQGGTWVYDRAGWCPGAPSDTEETDLTLFMNQGEDYQIDYNIETASGTSRYIVNSQLVKYGPINFENDATLADIIYPTKEVKHGRYNPNCGRPKVMIKNTGSEELTSLDIVYGIIGGATKTYNWTGNLEFNESEAVTLDYLPAMAASEDQVTFSARVENPNGLVDEYQNNDQMESTYDVVDMYTSDIVINLKTNNNFTETGFKVFDESGVEILSRGPGGLGSNVFYRDTLKNLNGCYKVVVTDSGENGLDWWANPNGGAGYVRISSLGQQPKTIATDFGSIVEYSFVAGEIMVGTEEPAENTFIDIFPNPGNDLFHLQAEGVSKATAVEVLDDMGRLIQHFPVEKNDGSFHQVIDLSQQSSGIYLVRIIEEAGSSHTRKLIKL